MIFIHILLFFLNINKKYSFIILNIFLNIYMTFWIIIRKNLKYSFIIKGDSGTGKLLYLFKIYKDYDNHKFNHNKFN